MPAASPMTSAPLGSTKPDAGVIATSPATAPEAMPRTAGLPLATHSDQHPGHRGRGGGDVGDGEGHARTPAGRERRAGVEPEPADPEQGGAD